MFRVKNIEQVVKKCLVISKPVRFGYTTEAAGSTLQKEASGLPARPKDWQNYKFTKVVESKEEFKFVKKLLPSPVVPDPPKHDSYPTPSGWLPPDYAKSSQLPYFVLRTRFHNFPIYPIVRNGSRKLVRIRYIEGDIWKFDKDLREFIEECIGQTDAKHTYVYSQVNEIQRHVLVKGPYEEYVNKFFIKCGF